MMFEQEYMDLLNVALISIVSIVKKSGQMSKTFVWFVVIIAGRNKTADKCDIL